MPVKRILALITLAATSLVAQQSQQSPSSLPKLVESIDVKVINVDVVVTDKKGNAVTGLTKDDFELFENGQPKLITNFYEVEGKKAQNISITGTRSNSSLTKDIFARLRASKRYGSRLPASRSAFLVCRPK